MDITLLVDQMIILLLIIGVGYILGKVKFIDEAMNTQLSKLVADILQAGIILMGLLNPETVIERKEALIYIGIAFLLYFFLFGLSMFTSRLLFASRRERGVYAFMTVFGNAAFMGYPVLIALYGTAGRFYAAIFNVPFGFLLFTIGIVLLTGSRKYLNPRLLLTPPLISSVIALTLYLAGIRVPDPVYRGIKTIGEAGIPIGMMIIGSSLSRIPLKKVFGNVRAYAYSATKLLLVPLIVWAVARLFISDEALLGVIVIVASMPSATVAVMFSIRYGADETTASRGVLLSTVLSGVTIPLVVSLLL